MNLSFLMEEWCFEINTESIIASTFLLCGDESQEIRICVSVVLQLRNEGVRWQGRNLDKKAKQRFLGIFREM